MRYRELPTEEDMSPQFHEWLRWLRLYEDKPKHTVRAYSQGVRRVVAFARADPESESEMYGRPPSDFEVGTCSQASLTDTVQLIRADVDDADRPRVSKATINQTLAALKSFFDFAIASLGATETPDVARMRKVLKVEPPEPKPEYYRSPDIENLFNVAKIQDNEGSQVRWASRDLAMCAFFAVLGLRSAELTEADRGWLSRARLEDNDRKATWILEVTGKGRRTRRLPLSAQLVEAHGRWQEERAGRFGPSRPDEPMFVTNDGERFNYNRLRYWLRVLNHAAGLKNRSLHSLRHTAGVQLAADGVQMNVIQKLMGHATIKTAGIYTDLAGGELGGVLERSEANRLLGDALEEAGR